MQDALTRYTSTLKDTAMGSNKCTLMAQIWWQVSYKMHRVHASLHQFGCASVLRQAQSTPMSGSTPPTITFRRMPHVCRPGLASTTAWHTLGWMSGALHVLLKLAS